MANIPPDTVVHANGPRYSELRYPPGAQGVLSIAVHAGALKSPSNRLTQVIQVHQDELIWAGTIDESMVNPRQEKIANSRAFLAAHLLRGPDLWKVITPGSLLYAEGSKTTIIYKGSRVWVVVGETPQTVLAAPLNSGSRDSLYQAPVYQAELPSGVTNPEDSKLEMNHLWSFPRNLHSLGVLGTPAHARLISKIRAFYP